jgi:predicted transcriptional regulator
VGALGGMAAFQDTKEQVEQKVIMHLLSEIERNPSFTQRKLALELGIALGLINRYLKSCMNKGWIRASQVSPKRISYFLTREGFMEKGQMVASYLTRSLTFFRDARLQCEEAFAICAENNWNKVALLGEGDLADIAQLVSNGSGIDVVIIDTNLLKRENPDILKTLQNDFDAVMVTSVVNPQGIYDLVKNSIDADRILKLQLLYISDQQEAA